MATRRTPEQVTELALLNAETAVYERQAAALNELTDALERLHGVRAWAALTAPDVAAGRPHLYVVGGHDSVA